MYKVVSIWPRCPTTLHKIYLSLFHIAGLVEGLAMGGNEMDGNGYSSRWLSPFCGLEKICAFS